MSVCPANLPLKHIASGMHSSFQLRGDLSEIVNTDTQNIVWYEKHHVCSWPCFEPDTDGHSCWEAGIFHVA